MSFNYETTINLVNELLGASGCAYYVRDIAYELQSTGGFVWEGGPDDLEAVRHLLKLAPVTAYHSASRIVVLPTTSQFDILRIEQTSGMRYGFDIEDIIKELSEIDTKFGVDIIGASFDDVEFCLQRKPSWLEVSELKVWLKRICPDYEVGTTSLDIRNGQISLWWD